MLQLLPLQYSPLCIVQIKPLPKYKHAVNYIIAYYTVQAASSGNLAFKSIRTEGEYQSLRKYLSTF